MRYLTPILFFAAAIGVFFYNAQASGHILIFPFIEWLWPAAEGDPRRLSQATVGLLLVLGLLTLIPRLIQGRRRRRQIEEAMD